MGGVTPILIKEKTLLYFASQKEGLMFFIALNTSFINFLKIMDLGVLSPFCGLPVPCIVGFRLAR